MKNFRSLVEVEVSLGDFTAIVGQNDSGKSNLLRALNLFFNSETDSGKKLDFNLDYSQGAKVVGKKAKQIEIEVIFSPPSNYADGVPICWRKIYRRDFTQTFQEEFFRLDGEEISKGSRVRYWVDQVAFEYVPAIRGRSFFKTLKRRLYDTLAATVAPRLQGASANFLSGLRAELKDIEDASVATLNIATEFSLPLDLGGLFEALDFDSADKFAKTPLDFRGHGIQGRHVPLILKFLAEQRKINSAKGKPSPETIWGFEEPENNLELSQQLELATEFRSYSRDLQIIVNTHSPAFYSEAAKKADGVLSVRRLAGKTTISAGTSVESIDADLGLMSFVAPYLANALADRDAMKAELSSLTEASLLRDRPALYVEGATDKVLLTGLIAAFELDIPTNFEILAKEGNGGGVGWVVGCCTARAAMHNPSYHTAALFDDYDAGREGIKLLKDRLSYLKKDSAVKCFTVGRETEDDYIRTIKKSKVKINFAIEEMCGLSAWAFAEQRGWLEPRTAELLALNHRSLAAKDNISDWIATMVPDAEVRRLVSNKVKWNKKNEFATHVVASMAGNNDTDIAPTLFAIVRSVATYLN